MTGSPLSAVGLASPTYSGPYKFLDYFEESDQFLFAGREQEIREIVARLSVDKTVVLYGRSGLGKTSLVLAGVFPELRERGFIPVYCRVLQNPALEIMHTFREVLHAPSDDKLKEEVRIKKVVLVLDQFEEFFIRFDKNQEARSGLVALLAELLGDSTSSIRVLISLREDYLARLDELKDEMPGMFSSEYRLRQLTAFGARQAITRPLTNKGIRYDSKLVSHILDIISVEDFDSLLLQIICSAVVFEATRSGRPDQLLDEDLQAVGGLDGILRRYLDAATGEVPSELRLVTRTILDALITSDNTKRAVTLASLQQWDFEADQTELGRALEILEQKRLVRREMRGRNVWYELAHERLVKPILQWFQLDRTYAEFRFAREVVINGARNEMFRMRPETLLAVETIDQVILPFHDRLRLNAQQIEFMFWSAVYRQSSQAEYWGKKLQPDQSRSILLDLMKRSDPTARQGAATAAPFVADSNSDLAKECLRLAVSDPVAKVRRAGRRSLAKLAGNSEVQALHGLLRRRGSRRAALEALAEFDPTSRVFKCFGWLSRRLAGRIRRRRLISGNKRLLNQWTKTGVLTALIGGLVWTFSIAPLFLTFVAWNGGALDYVPLLQGSELAIFLLYSFPVIIVGSMIIGLFVGRGTARLALQSKPLSWWRAWIYLLAIYLVTVGVVAVFLLWDDWRGLLTFTWIDAALAVPVSIAIVCHVRFMSSGMMDRFSSVVKRWKTGLFHATAPFLIAGSIGIASSRWFGHRGGIVIALLAAYIWSVIAFIWSTSLVEVELRETGEVHTQLRLYAEPRVSQMASAACIVCLSVAYLLVFGIHSIPIFAQHVSVAGDGLSFDAHPGAFHFVPNNIFVRVDREQASPNLYAVASPISLKLIGSTESAEVLYLPLGKWLGGVTSGNWKNAWTTRRVSLQAVPKLDGLNVSDEWKFVALQLHVDRTQTPPAWLGEVNATVGDEDDDIEVMPLSMDNSWRGPFKANIRGELASAPTGVLHAYGGGLRRPTPGPDETPKDSDQSQINELLLPATVASGDQPISFSTGEGEMRYYPRRQLFWVARSLGGKLTLWLRLGFSENIDQGGSYPYVRRLTPQELSKDDIQKLPSDLTIVLGIRKLRAGPPR